MTTDIQYNSALEELYEKKRTIYHTMQNMQKVDAVEWSNEDHEKWDTLDKDITQVDVDIEAEKKSQQRMARMAQLEERNAQQEHADRSTAGEMRAWADGRIPGRTQEQMNSLALSGWMLYSEADSDMQFACKQAKININDTKINVRCFPDSAAVGDFQVYSCQDMTRRIQQVLELRQQGTTPDTAGGYTVPQGVMQPLEIALLQFGAPRQYSSTIRAGNGREIPWPTTNDTSNKGRIVAENTTTTQTDVVFGQVTTKPFMYSSDYIPVSLQLLQDSATNMQALLGQLMGERIGRIQSDHFTTGTGSGEPRGITIDAPSAATLASAGAPTPTELYELKHSVDPAYRMMGHGWCFNDQILKQLKLLNDTQNRPLWTPGLAFDAPNTIDGDRYFINQSMPNTGLSAKVVLYGQLDKYKIHDGLDMQMQRLDELHALLHQRTFLAWMRSDGRLLDAGTNPVKALSNPAS